MAAASPSDSALSLPRNVVIKTEPESEDDLLISPADVPVKRDPVVPLLSPVSGLQPLAWSQDHRLAVCTSSSMSLLELVCDVHSNKQDLTLHRTSIPVPTEALKLRVNIHQCSPVYAVIKEKSMDPCSTVTAENVRLLIELRLVNIETCLLNPEPQPV